MKNMIALIVFLQLILEALPISSSSHVLLISRLLNFKELPEEFDHFLHGPWAIVLMIFFYKEWWRRVWWFLPNSFMPDNLKRHSVKLNQIAYKLFLFAFIANVITGIFYFIIKSLKIENGFILILGLIITLLFLVSIPLKEDQNYQVLNFKKVTLLGIMQGLSLLPGISRFASTYVVARLLQLSPRRAFQTSFLIQFPTCIAAFLKGTYSLWKMHYIHIFTMSIFLSFLFGSIISYFLLWLSWNLALRDKFWIFGMYMLIPISFAFLVFFSFL